MYFNYRTNIALWCSQYYSSIFGHRC